VERVLADVGRKGESGAPRGCEEDGFHLKNFIFACSMPRQKRGESVATVGFRSVAASHR